MAFGKPDNYRPEEIEILSEDWHEPLTELIPSEVELKPNDWFEIGAELGKMALEEFEKLPRFEENERPMPEY
jgi:hypothetical protein